MVYAYRSFLVDWFDEELLVIEGNISDLAPGEADLWGHPVKYWHGLTSWSLVYVREQSLSYY